MRDKITRLLRETRHTHTASIAAKGEAQIEQFMTAARMLTAGVGIYEAHKLTQVQKVPKTQTSNLQMGALISEDKESGSKTFAATCDVTITIAEVTTYNVVIFASSSKVRKALDRVIGRSLEWIEISKIPQEIDVIPAETGPKEGVGVN